jgi:hypothetical protein
MPVPAKYPRYVKASLAKHAKDAMAAQIGPPALAAIPLVVEGLDDKVGGWQTAHHKIEMEFHGPRTREINGFYIVDVDVFATVTSNLGTDENAYAHDDVAGRIASAFDRCIEVKDYEATGGGTNTLGTLSPSNARADRVAVTPIAPSTTDKQQFTVVEVKLTGYFPK